MGKKNDGLKISESVNLFPPSTKRSSVQLKKKSVKIKTGK